MGTTALRQLLRSLCNNSHWKYAVLWKLRHGNPMILTWEDGYFDYPKPRETVETILDDVNGNGVSDVFPSQFETSISTGTSICFPIGLVVADISRLQYGLGDGVVGKVAYTGNHCWVSFNKIFSGEVNTKLVSECPEEWLPQFASGIKTILLVPVLPLGVLQLGSLEELAEDIEIVAYVKGRFNSLHGIGGNTVHFSFDRDFQAQLSSSLISGPIEYSTSPSHIAISPVKSEDSNHSVAVNNVMLDNDNLSTLNEVLPLLTVAEVFQPSENDLLEALKYQSKNKIDVPSIGLHEVSTPSESTNCSQLELMESKLFELSSLMEELQTYSEFNDYNMGLFGESFNEILNFYPPIDMTLKLLEEKAAYNMDHKVVSSCLHFPEDCELHKALGPGFQQQTNDKNSSLLVEDTCSTSNVISNKDPNDRTVPSVVARGSDVEYLLEAVVANACTGSDDNSSDRSNSYTSPSSWLGHFAASSQQRNKSKASTWVKDESVPLVYGTSAFTAGGRNDCTTALKGMMNTIFDEENMGGGYNDIQPQKGQKMSNVGKRRPKPGDNPRPRPRDRQLIQDRMKELRELVPNGAKCSIDGLLDRTVRHILYLRSVTDQAEKLKQWMNEEAAASKKSGSSETKDNNQNGTSWAFEFGSELLTCPIVVEDLAHPGHLLIEILCNEHILFLEIAQVIRGLDLTILKGVMESRSNDTWAHFIVEASKGFHRLDIFWPLMQLLQRKRNPISSKI